LIERKATTGLFAATYPVRRSPATALATQHHRAQRFLKMVATRTDTAVVERDAAIVAYEKRRDAHTLTKEEVVELRRRLKEAERCTEVAERDLQLMALKCKQEGRDGETDGEHEGTHTNDKDLPNKLPGVPVQLPSKSEAATNLSSQALNRANFPRTRFDDNMRRRLEALEDTARD
jgi:hypothetical protein